MLHQLHREGALFSIEVIIPFKNQARTHEVKLILDTGAAITVIDTDIIDHLGYSARDDGVRRSTLDGAAGRSVGYVITAPFFKCLGFELKEFPIACHDMDTRLGVAGLLGMNFLKHFEMHVNFLTGRIAKMTKIS